MNTQRSAVVLSGGGAYAAYEVGVLKALAEGNCPATEGIPLDPDILTGTSAGAFNAAFLTGFGDSDFSGCVEELIEVWMHELCRGCGDGVFRYRANFLDLECFAREPGRTAALLVEDVAFLVRDGFRRLRGFRSSNTSSVEEWLIQNLDSSALVDVSRLDRFFHDVIEGDGIAASRRRLRVAVTNWRTGELETVANEAFREDGAWRLLTASVSVPGIFPPVEINGVPYVDGGVLMNTPLTPAIEEGADILNVIYLDPDIAAIPLRALRSTVETLDRMNLIRNAALLNVDFRAAERINRQVAVAEAIGQPVVAQTHRSLTLHRYRLTDTSGDTLGSLRFTPDFVADLIRKGYEDAIGHDCVAQKCVVPSSGLH